MISFEDKDGVWNFGKIVRDEECANQIIKENILTWYGENFIDTEKGVKWYKYINTATFDEEIITEMKTDITKAIFDTHLVKEIK